MTYYVVKLDETGGVMSLYSSPSEDDADKIYDIYSEVYPNGYFDVVDEDEFDELVFNK